jgi:hypothetical protein
MALNFFTRKRYNLNPAPVHFVRADILVPGAEGFAPVPSEADPVQFPLVNPVTRFVPFRASQPGLVNQGLALVDSPAQGFPFDGVITQNLVSPDEYPSVYPALAEEED